MLVLDSNSIFAESELQSIIDTLADSECKTVIVPVISTFTQRPTIGAMLEDKGVRVVAARQCEPERLHLAATGPHMAYLLGIDNSGATPGPYLTQDADGNWRTPAGRFIPSWNPRDPLPSIPADVVLPPALLSWTDAYLCAVPFSDTEADALVKKIPEKRVPEDRRWRVTDETRLLLKNPTQTRIVSDAADIVATLHAIDRHSTGFGRGSAFASDLCYALGINLVPSINGVIPLKFFDNIDRVPDVDINISQRNRDAYLDALINDHHAHRLVVVTKSGKVQPHPSAITLRSMDAATSGVAEYGLTGSDARVLKLPVIDLLSSRVVDQFWDLYQRLGPTTTVPESFWTMFCDGNTYGLPEIGTALGRRLSRTLKPTSFQDLERLVALVRPGTNIKDLTPDNWRDGLVFQDDARARLVEHGMNLGAAFVVVNAIAKKQPLPESLIIPESAAPLVDELRTAGYLTPREHAQAYARQIYTLAVYRYTHPDVYLDYTAAYVDDTQLLITQVAKSRQLEVVMPTLNSASAESRIIDKRLHVGLIPVVGASGAQAIIHAREIAPFAENPADFKRRLGYDPPCIVGC